MKKIIFTLLSCMFALIASTQITFERSYNIYNSAFADLVISCPDGYIMAMIGEKEKKYLSLVKTNLNGDIIWTRDHDYIDFFTPELVGTDDSEGNIYIFCQALDNKLLKFNSSGSLVWAKSMSALFPEMLVKDDTLYMCGNVSYGNFLYKVSTATGDSLWKSSVFTSGGSAITSMVLLDNGEVIVTTSEMLGYTGNLGVTEYYRLPVNASSFIKFDLQLDKQIVIRDSKNIGNEIVSVGNILNEFSIEKTCYYMRYTADGTVLALKEEIFDYYYAYLLRCAVSKHNEVVALGYMSNDGTNSEMMLHSFSLNGDSIWTQIPGKMAEFGWDIINTSDEGFIVTGGIKVDNEYYLYHPFLIKTNSLGTLNSIGEKNQFGFTYAAYPNPASDYVVFSHPDTSNGTITIIDVNGRVCSQLNIKGNSTTWYTREMKPGLYSYLIQSNNSLLSGRIVIK